MTYPELPRPNHELELTCGTEAYGYPCFGKTVCRERSSGRFALAYAAPDSRAVWLGGQSCDASQPTAEYAEPGSNEDL